MGEWRVSIKMVIVASAESNTTATRTPAVPTSKKQSAAPKAAVSKSRTRKAAAVAVAPVSKKKPRAAAPVARANGKGKPDLVIVESPAKAKTINKYLGSNYRVLASYGHVRDLPKRRKKGEIVAGIDIEAGWKPTYVVGDKDEKDGRSFRRTPKDILAELKREAAKSNRVLLATDPDREGEAIAWHIRDALNLADDRTYRITFNE